MHKGFTYFQAAPHVMFSDWQHWYILKHNEETWVREEVSSPYSQAVALFETFRVCENTVK